MKMDEKTMKDLTDLFGDLQDQGAAFLVLDICKAMDSDIVLLSLIGTLIQMFCDRTGANHNALIEYIKAVHEEIGG